MSNDDNYEKRWNSSSAIILVLSRSPHDNSSGPVTTSLDVEGRISSFDAKVGGKWGSGVIV